MVLYGVAWHGTVAWYATAWYGTARHGMGWDVIRYYTQTVFMCVRPHATQPNLFSSQNKPVRPDVDAIAGSAKAITSFWKRKQPGVWICFDHGRPKTGMSNVDMNNLMSRF